MHFRNMAILAVIAAAFLSAAPATGSDGGRQYSIKFPAFSLSPGERVRGVTMTTSAGLPRAGCRPNRWTCENEGDTVHCYSLHPQYATAISGMLPEFFVRNAAGASLSVDASVEFIDNDGREYSRSIRQDELIIR